MSLPAWPRERQAALYEAIGYRQTGQRPDGTVWTRPAETDRFLYNWDDRIHVVICPARASKSYSAAKKVLPLVLGRQHGPDGPKPTRGWIVGPTYELAEKEFRYLWQDLKVTLPALGLPPPSISRDSKKGGDLYLLMPWGAEIVGKSADKPQSLLGEELDWVLLSEAAKLPGDIWTRYLEPRLSTTQGYAVLPTTPDEGAMWLYDLYVKGLQANDVGVAAYSWDVSGNPTYPLQELERARKMYGEAHPVFREQYLGEWTFYAGRVYAHDWDPARNLIEPYAIPEDWPRLRGLDFGYRDPFVCLWAAVTPDGTLDVYREYYQPGRAMAEHAAVLRQYPEPILYSVADASEQQSIADLRRLGVPALDALRDRRAGRMLVGDYLRAGRLRFFRGATPQTIRELAAYKWDVDKNKEGAKEATLGDDHAMDVLRYLCMSRPQPRPVVRPPAPQTFGAELAKRTRERLRQMRPVFSR